VAGPAVVVLGQVADVGGGGPVRLVDVLMVAEMLATGFVVAIRGRACPNQLHGKEQGQEQQDQAAHLMQIITVRLEASRPCGRLSG
jgi:hypothetical protein